MKDICLILTIGENVRAVLFAAGKLLSGVLPLCDRFMERRPGVFSVENSSSGVQRDTCEEARKLTGR
jgi:hypothetical protein